MLQLQQAGSGPKPKAELKKASCAVTEPGNITMKQNKTETEFSGNAEADTETQADRTRGAETRVTTVTRSHD